MAIIEYLTRNDSDIEIAASSLGKQPHSGLLVIPEPFTVSHRDQIIAQSARFNLPAINTVPGSVERGALASYTYDYAAIVGEPVSYIDRILKGDSPSNLPVQAPTKYELSINLKTAKVLGLTVPPTVLATADNVIE